MVEEKTITVGKAEPIKSIDELPRKLLDSLLEGLTTAPQDFAIMAMGFMIGYEGLDVMAMIMKPFHDTMTNVGKVMMGAVINPLELTMPMATLPIQMGNIGLDVLKVAGGPILWPNKHITPAAKIPETIGPGASYYGPPPTGYTGEWPPYGTSLSKLEQTIKDSLDTDPNKLKLQLEQIAAEQKLKILMGCMGALTAYTLTRPGVVTSIVGAVGEVASGALQGLGEAVPF